MFVVRCLRPCVLPPYRIDKLLIDIEQGYRLPLFLFYPACRNLELFLDIVGARHLALSLVLAEYVLQCGTYIVKIGVYLGRAFPGLVEASVFNDALLRDELACVYPMTREKRYPVPVERNHASDRYVLYDQ